MALVVPYDATWPGAFAAEAARIRARLGDRALRIDHVGSTAVPGLAAKPVIDIQVSVAALHPRHAWHADMTALGYRSVDLGAFDLVYPFFTRPDVWPCTHHVHLCTAGSSEERRHLAFRDHLRLDPLAAAEYGRLKRELATLHEGTTLETQERYSLAKSTFVERVVAKALQRGLPLPAPSDA